jgi:hypothetical protein
MTSCSSDGCQIRYGSAIAIVIYGGPSTPPKALDSLAQIRKKTATDDDEKQDEVVDSSDRVRQLKTR